MKSLFFGVVLILLLGVAGFFYRNVMETSGTPEPIACTMDARICPDNSAVGRTGPSCEFALCPLPNIEDRAIGVAFVIPSGYISNVEPIGADQELRIVLDKEAPGGIPHNMILRQFGIGEGETAEEVMIANTMFETSGMPAESIDQFETTTIDGRTFYRITVERFEAIIHTHYYLPRAEDVLRFEVLERDVTNWMEPELDIETLPEHAALREALETLQISE